MRRVVEKWSLVTGFRVKSGLYCALFCEDGGVSEVDGTVGLLLLRFYFFRNNFKVISPLLLWVPEVF